MAGELNLGSLIYELGFEDEQAFLRALDRTLDRAEDRSERSGRDAGQGFSRGMSRFIGSAALGGLIGGATAQAFGMASAAVGDFVRDLDQRAVQIQASMRKATVVFGETLPTVQAWARQNANALGLTTQQAVALAAGAQDLLVPMGFVREEAVDISTTLIGLSGALAEWSGGQRTSAEVADTLTAALLGERDALTGLGISISAADVEARLAAKGQKDLEGALLQQAEAQATLELILEKSTDAQRAFADGANEPIRKMQLQKAAIQESKDALALDLIPVMQTYYEDVAPELVRWTGEAVSVFGQFMQGFMDAKDIDPADYTFFTGMGEAFRGIANTIGGAIEKFEQWRFLVTGTNAELLGMERDQEQGFIERYGEELGAQVVEAENRLASAQDAVAQTQKNIDDLRTGGWYVGRARDIQNQEEALALLQAEASAAMQNFRATVQRATQESRQQNVSVFTPELINPPSSVSTPSPTPTPNTTGPSSDSSDSRVSRTPRTVRPPPDPTVKWVKERQEAYDLLQLRRENDLIDQETYVRELNALLGSLMNEDLYVKNLGEAGARLAEVVEEQRTAILRLASSVGRELGGLQSEVDITITPTVSATSAAREVTILGQEFDASTGTWVAKGPQPTVTVTPQLSIPIPQASARLVDEYARTLSLAEGNVSRLIRVQERLGLVSRVDLRRALEEQAAALETLLAGVKEGSDDYMTFASSLVAVRRELNGLAVDISVTPTVTLTQEGQDALEAGRQRERDAQEAARSAEQELARLEADLTSVALSFPRALVSGIKENDVGGALQGALGSASDFFIEQMIQGILGPIAQSFAKSLAPSLGGGGRGGFNPLSLVLGIGLPLVGGLLGGLFGGRPKPAAQRASETRASSGSPSITYQASTTLNFALGADLKDPATLAEVRALAREETLAVLEQLGKLKK